ncbi:MAG TPA: biotin/lipoyl-containing protein, partial [Chloroflexota bacterium]|nr:biotin/lipoyl-containing protein [Chloroflexota bacterium]
AGAKHTVSDGGVLAQVLRQDVQALLRTLQGSGVEEIRLERSGRRIVLRRTWETTAPVSVEEAPAHADLSRLAIPGRTEVHAQVVGVFHRAREVDGPPLANEGDHVEVGKVLGVVETLGLATDVTAPIRGRLSEFVAHDGQPVEYGQLIAVVVPE